MARGFLVSLTCLPAATVNVRIVEAVRGNDLQKQVPSADTFAVMNTANTQTLPMRTLYAPNPPQLDDPWMRALIVLLVVFGFAALFALGS